MKTESAFHFLKGQRSNFDFFKRYPAGILWEKKLTPNFYAVTDGSFMEIWDCIGSYIGVPFSVKHPSWGFTLPLIFLPQILTFLWQKRERERVVQKKITNSKKNRRKNNSSSRFSCHAKNMQHKKSNQLQKNLNQLQNS